MSARNALAWRTGLVVAAWISIIPFMSGAANAQPFEGNAPWCANLGYLGTALERAYYSLEQCMARASGLRIIVASIPGTSPSGRSRVANGATGSKIKRGAKFAKSASPRHQGHVGGLVEHPGRVRFEAMAG
jgi:hypothetical protein